MRTIRKVTTIGGALMALLFVSGAQAQGLRDAPPGATSCLGCHGAQPTSLPALSNLSASDIENAMEQFRSGSREATLMNRIAKGFTPEESKAMAVWLSAMK
jgi:cytochrome c553